MKLVEVQVRNFRNILDSTAVAIDPTVTCLVGKNESGKTAFLHALYRLLPARPNVTLSAPDQYPAWLEKRDRMRGVEIEKFRPVRATFALEAGDVAALEAALGTGVLASAAVTLERSYEGELVPHFSTDEAAAVKHLLGKVSLPAPIANKVGSAKSVDDLRSAAAELTVRGEDAPRNAAAGQQIAKAIEEALGDGSVADAAWRMIENKIPQFFYFHEYSTLPYSVKIQRLLTADPSTLDDDELTARSLLGLAAAEAEYLLNPNYERRKRELENVANALTADVLQYWSQNPELRVLPDITQVTESTSRGQQAVLDELKIRIWDQRHSLSLPFDEHSTGFQWFFSFLAAFAEYEHRERPVVILLDEPALGLHARAQADFLRFIDERLAKRCQVIYTIHSPFMIQPSKLERVRLVEDRSREFGAKVTQEVLTTDKDTLFPLQGALGYDLVQHLFIAPHNLIVEGTSDYTYLRLISDFLKGQQGRESLDERWSLVPVGGVELIPTFVALLGAHLNVTVIVDSRKVGHQRLDKLTAAGILEAQRIIGVGSVICAAAADIEDLFEPDEYLLLFNKAFGKSITVGDLAGSDPIVARIARHLGIERFDHGLPADVFLRERDTILPRLSQDTLRRFEALFAKANATLPK